MSSQDRHHEQRRIHHTDCCSMSLHMQSDVSGAVGCEKLRASERAGALDGMALSTAH